jgi:magnesium transporter
MTRLRPEAPPQARPALAPRIRAVYRAGSGKFHLNWPDDQVQAAVEDHQGVVWVDIEDRDSASNGEVEALLRDVFHFHPLAVEDALRETHVPRVDDWGEYLYIVFHSIALDPDSDHARLHEIDLFLGPNYLVTHHTEPLEFLEQEIRNIERDPANRLGQGADHLLYRLLDLAVAEYLPAIEHLDEAIDNAQEEVFRKPTPRTLQAIFRVKRSALRLHRTLAPEREVLNRLARDHYQVIADEHQVYFRDVYDHLVRIHDVSESLRDLISGALDTYLSAISNRTNDIMKVLTLVTVMFLPMSVLTSFFGMNFFGDNLAFRTPLPKALLFIVTCLVMATTPWGMWLWARRRGWL